MKSSKAENLRYLVLALPAIVAVIVLSVVPIVSMFATSFTNWNLMSPAPPSWSGADNYMELFRDTRFLSSIGRQVLLSAMTVALQLLIGVVLALILNKARGFLRFLRGFIVVPFVLPPVVVALIWLTIFTPAISPINTVLKAAFSIPGPMWLTNSTLALISIAVADAWSNFPFTAIIVLSALQSIPHEIYESADIDGASALSKTFRISLPMIKWAIMMCLLMRIIESLKAFPLIFIMTSGGPGVATEVTNYYAYTQTFQYFQVGYGSAIICVVFLATFVCSLLLLKRDKE